jgi:hypothetical protein
MGSGPYPGRGICPHSVWQEITTLFAGKACHMPNCVWPAACSRRHPPHVHLAVSSTIFSTSALPFIDINTRFHASGPSQCCIRARMHPSSRHADGDLWRGSHSLKVPGCVLLRGKEKPLGIMHGTGRLTAGMVLAISRSTPRLPLATFSWLDACSCHCNIFTYRLRPTLPWMGLKAPFLFFPSRMVSSCHSTTRFLFPPPHLSTRAQ